MQPEHAVTPLLALVLTQADSLTDDPVEGLRKHIQMRYISSNTKKARQMVYLFLPLKRCEVQLLP